MIMKNLKAFLGFVFFATILFLAMFNTKLTNKEEKYSALTLANIEALAQGENWVPNTTCFITISSSGSGNLTHITWCGSCNPELAKSWSGEIKCNKHEYE
jgi:hypothetical protein